MTEIERKREKYICPCGFASYDLMEFLKHPFMGYLNKQDQEATGKLQEGNQEGVPSEATGEEST
jgi:hypothetical protein